MSKTFLIAAALLAGQAIPAQATENIVNGNFETGTGTAATGWYQTGFGSVLRLQGQDYQICCSAPGSAAALANHFISFGAGDTFVSSASASQIFNSVAGKAYTLSFDFGAFGGPQQLTYFVGNATPLATGTISASGTTNLDSIFGHYTANFIGDGTPLTVFFSAGGSDTFSKDAFLDNVSVTSVPEPLAWSMMIAGFGLVGGAMRRRAPKVSFG